MNRIMALLAGIVLVFAAAACSSGGSNDNPTGRPSSVGLSALCTTAETRASVDTGGGNDTAQVKATCDCVLNWMKSNATSQQVADVTNGLNDYLYGDGTALTPSLYDQAVTTCNTFGNPAGAATG